MAIKPEYFDMSQQEIEADYEAEGKCKHGTPNGEPCEDCKQVNQTSAANSFAVEEGSFDGTPQSRERLAGTGDKISKEKSIENQAARAAKKE